MGAKLLTHAGGLTNLSKLPASTIQILGAEKALFRALKKKGNTPKYGFIYNTTFISRAEGRAKGKVSRYLANKCALAARLDSHLLKVRKSSPESENLANQQIRRKDENPGRGETRLAELWRRGHQE